MSFHPQPYPLFAAFHEGTKRTTARIIGWVTPDGGTTTSTGIQAVALHSRPGGDISEPKYLDLEHEAHWLGDTADDALTQMLYFEG